MTTLIHLEEYADQFLQDNYNLRLTIPIKQNNRLRRTMGRYKAFSTGEPSVIEIAGYTLQYADKNILLGVLKHELIHYALHMLDKPYSDGHPYFENELKKHNAPSTHTISVGKFHQLQCKKCKKISKTKTKNVVKNIHLYRSRCCKSDLSFVGEVISNGIKEVKL